MDSTDPETPLSVLRRFGITTLAENFDECTVTASIPVGGMTNPLTGQPSLASLAVLVDDVAGRVNYYRRGRGQWTVSSELTVEVGPGALEVLLAHPDDPVVAAGDPLGAAGSTLLSTCTLTHRDAVIGRGTVHTVPISGGPQELPRRGDDPVAGRPGASLADLMAVEPLPPGPDGSHRLRQLPDPMINNLIGIVHGGVSGAGLELVAAAALNHGQSRPLQTASIRVNFLRPFFATPDAGAQSECGGAAVYEGTALRVGRTVAVGDSRAVGADGTVAVIARVTAYR